MTGWQARTPVYAHPEYLYTCFAISQAYQQAMLQPSAPPPVDTRIHLPEMLAVAGMVLLLGLAVTNILSNMAAAGVTPGFAFLAKAAGFDVSEALIPYGPDHSYGRVILAGLANTLFLAAVCLVLATVIGVAFGLLGVGPSPIGRGVALAYVEVFRNLPKLLVLLVLFVVAVNGLPHVRDALRLGPFHLSNRALAFPVPVWTGTTWILAAAAGLGIGLTVLWRRLDRHWRASTGCGVPALPIAVFLALPAFAALVFEGSLGVSVPELKGFDIEGGGRLSLQFIVIAATLSIYHGAQIAEVVRGGLLSIPKGQTEAARALGLNPWQVQRLVLLPQVVRIVVPPLNNQYVNLIKNTSISIAIGYSDLMSVSGTIINQSFRPFEMMLITMGLYLAVCVGVTAWINRYHRRLTARETR